MNESNELEWTRMREPMPQNERASTCTRAFHVIEKMKKLEQEKE